MRPRNRKRAQQLDFSITLKNGNAAFVAQNEIYMNGFFSVFNFFEINGVSEFFGVKIGFDIFL